MIIQQYKVSACVPANTALTKVEEINVIHILPA